MTGVRQLRLVVEAEDFEAAVGFVGALTAAGLLVATRRGRNVDYRRSPRGDLFVA